MLFAGFLLSVQAEFYLDNGRVRVDTLHVSRESDNYEPGKDFTGMPKIPHTFTVNPLNSCFLGPEILHELGIFKLWC